MTEYSQFKLVGGIMKWPNRFSVQQKFFIFFIHLIRKGKLIKEDVSIITVIIAFMCLITSCVKSPYIGKSVSLYSSEVCRCSILPSTCSKSDDFFNMEYTIRKGDQPNEYFVEGFADGRGKKGEQWDEITEGGFFILLVKNDGSGIGTISDQINIRPKSTELMDRLNFSKKFNSEEKFEGVIFSYNISVVWR